jgi:hypothetical protein
LLLLCIIRTVAGSWLEALARSRSRLKFMVNAGVKVKGREWLMTSPVQEPMVVKQTIIDDKKHILSEDHFLNLEVRLRIGVGMQVLIAR